MAPLDPDAVGRSNTLPLALFSGQVLLIAGLTGNILHTIYRAARSLPPATATRAQQSLRLRNTAIFSTLGLLSLASVTTFAVAWRVLSYFEWAQKGNHEAPGTLWAGWYGTGEEGVGRWRLGDWWNDVDRIEQSDAEVLAAPESFLYLYQHFCGVTAAAIFFGVEGECTFPKPSQRRRKIDVLIRVHRTKAQFPSQNDRVICGIECFRKSGTGAEPLLRCALVHALGATRRRLSATRCVVFA
jgi:hypothetical protein